jgi:hypothetical protein
MMITAHVLYGATTALVAERVLRRRKNGRAKQGGGRAQDASEGEGQESADA